MAGSVSLADVSRFMVGSDTLELTPFYLSTFTIPGLVLSHPALPTRSGVSMHVGADTVDYGSLNLSVMLDANFDTYFELLKIASQETNHEQGTFSTPSFDLWVAILDQENNTLFRFDFLACRIQSIGELTLDPDSELGATFSVEVVYDYYTWERTKTCGSHKIVETPDTFYDLAPAKPKRLQQITPSIGLEI